MAPSKLLALRFDVPEGYADLSTLSFVKESGEGFRTNVLATHEAYDGTLDAYVDAMAEAFATELGDYEVLGRHTDKAGGKSAIVLDQRFADQGTKVRQKQLFVAHDGTVYIVTVTDLETRAAECDAVLGRITKSLKVA